MAQNAMLATWSAGAAEVDITPTRSVFLYGYPHVNRWSTGIHDPLLSSALCLSNGQTTALFVANDLICVSNVLVTSARRRIEEATGIPSCHIMISATHTHSGPVLVDAIASEDDPVVPKPDPDYLAQVENGIVEAATMAHRSLRPASPAWAIADGSAVGTNRRDPYGPAIPQTPVLIVRDAHADRFLALMTVCSMHATVLHEDSTLISGDFPGLTRRHLKRRILGEACPVVWHMGASGNQSPRHVARANTFEEADRLGGLLAGAITQAFDRSQPIHSPTLSYANADIQLPLREFPDVNTATLKVAEARRRLQTLQEQEGAHPAIRTAEVDWFGAEKTLTLAKATEAGRVRRAADACLPAEIQVLRVGELTYVGWPGEVFVEFALELMGKHENTFIVTQANGTLQSYLATQDAIDQHAYEAGAALFRSPNSGQLLVEATERLLVQNALSIDDASVS